MFKLVNFARQSFNFPTLVKPFCWGSIIYLNLQETSIKFLCIISTEPTALKGAFTIDQGATEIIFHSFCSFP